MVVRVASAASVTSVSAALFRHGKEKRNGRLSSVLDWIDNEPNLQRETPWKWRGIRTVGGAKYLSVFHQLTTGTDNLGSCYLKLPIRWNSHFIRPRMKGNHSGKKLEKGQGWEITWKKTILNRIWITTWLIILFWLPVKLDHSMIICLKLQKSLAKEICEEMID